MKDGVCYGCEAMSQSETQYFYAKAIILATGGLGQLYTYNTNPPVATGDGISLAYLAGAALQDMEFVQFHPTTLYLGDKKPISLFLISEATRGEGGVLRNVYGDRFMSTYHPLAELAPRDIVSRAIFTEMKESHSSHVYLDLTGVNKNLSRRFPTIYNRCLEAKIDISKDFIPVAPAAHYFMGGIKTNEWGQTSIHRLYAAGEVASLSLHGANRLASNSLLDGLVFGHRSAQHAGELVSFSQQEMTGIFKNEKEISYTKNNPLSTVLKCRQRCRQVMWEYVGIVRDKKGLEKALREFEILSQSLDRVEKHLLCDETQHMVRLATLITQAALKREESRGAHFRSDFPKKREMKKELVTQYKN